LTAPLRSQKLEKAKADGAAAVEEAVATRADAQAARAEAATTSGHLRVVQQARGRCCQG
jgi:hypothetical protein